MSMSTTSLIALAANVLATAQEMNRCGINRGSAGNVSVRCRDEHEAFIVTPTGMAYDACTAADMVKVSLRETALGTDEPDCLAPLNSRLPSSEWRFHQAIYRAFPSAGAVVHTHSPFATALACQGLEIPAFHYMVARFGGDSVRCANYATFGTQELSDAAVQALSDRCACLMAHHGMLVYGRHLEHALALAVELETLAEQYWRTLQLGPAKLLDSTQMAIVLQKFAAYGQQASE
jgi:L-fuculose-phosphate aldolase